ncbi:MAG: alpha/beta hydrolase [Alistipes sp.]|nr:alpha/beta hydrolase [Alistipes sp.]
MKSKRYISALTALWALAACPAPAHAQGPEVGHGRGTPLSEVLDTIAGMYGASISYTEQQMEGKTVDYAPWRIRGDIHSSLKGILDLFGMGYYNAYGTDRFRIGEFEYYRWSVAEGEQFLRKLESATPTLPAWERRREEIGAHLPAALMLDGLPARLWSEPVEGPLQTRDGYALRNVALEVLPGYYVCGTVYFPEGRTGLRPVVLCPNGHWEGGRYRDDHQYLCASLARMGAVAASYDLFAWGEGLLQFEPEDHSRELSMTLQTVASMRWLDYLLAMPGTDSDRVGVTGGSGAGTHSVLLTALDERIKVCAPVVSLSCHFFGGCPCESGMPVHVKDGKMFTNNVEIAAMAAPRPMLVVSDGADWTFKVPEIEYPYLRRMYALYGAEDAVENVHFGDGKHDFGPPERQAVYGFMARRLGLDPEAAAGPDGTPDESGCTVEPVEGLLCFGPDDSGLPAGAVKGYDSLAEVLESLRKANKP